MKLEKLLNKLIEKGYCPRGIKDANVIVYNGVIKVEYRGIYQMYHIRELVSKESGLWQFVCENGIVNKESHERVYDISFGPYGPDCKVQIISREYQYRLIESALCDEDKLEQFLLDNIKIDE